MQTEEYSSVCTYHFVILNNFVVWVLCVEPVCLYVCLIVCLCNRYLNKF